MAGLLLVQIGAHLGVIYLCLCGHGCFFLPSSIPGLLSLLWLLLFSGHKLKHCSLLPEEWWFS